MDRQNLLALQNEGYTYLLRKAGEEAYTPIKGDLEEVTEQVSVEPLSEDELISIEDAIEFCEHFECRLIVVQPPDNDFT